MRLTCACLMIAGLMLFACVPPPGPLERLGYSAHEMNAATRFARMDIALSYVKSEAQHDFARRHRKWHKQLRIVDLEVTGVQMVTTQDAEVHLTVSWHRLDQTTIRDSMIAQKWSQKSGDWKLVEEMRAGGSPGLFMKSRGKRGKGSKSSRKPSEPALGQITTNAWQ